MTQLVTLGQAARNALSLYLTTELEPVAGGDGVVVEPRWFEKDRQLPPRAISIINAGPRQLEWLDPEEMSVELIGDKDAAAPQAKVAWKLAYMTQPLHLDVWTTSDVDLDDILARLDVSLNKGQGPYNGALEPTPITNNDPVMPGVLLALGDGWAPGTSDFLFDSTDAEPSSAQVLEGEWRATLRGVANAMLVVVAQSPRIARFLLQQRLRKADPVDTTAPYDTTTIANG